MVFFKVKPQRLLVSGQLWSWVLVCIVGTQNTRAVSALMVSQLFLIFFRCVYLCIWVFCMYICIRTMCADHVDTQNECAMFVCHLCTLCILYSCVCCMHVCVVSLCVPCMYVYWMYLVPVEIRADRDTVFFCMIVVTFCMWVMGPNSGSSAGAIRALNHGTVSLIITIIIFYYF